MTDTIDLRAQLAAERHRALDEARDNERLRAERDAVMRERDEARAALATAEQRAEQTYNDRIEGEKAFRAALANATKERDEAIAEMHEQMAICERHQLAQFKRIDTAERALAAAQATIAGLRAALEYAEASQSEWRRRANAAEQRNQMFDAHMESCGECHECLIESGAAEKERDEARAEVNRLSATVDRKDEQMAELQDYIKDDGTPEMTLRRDLAAAQATIAGLREALGRARNVIADIIKAEDERSDAAHKCCEEGLIGPDCADDCPQDDGCDCPGSVLISRAVNRRNFHEGDCLLAIDAALRDGGDDQ